jgi:hypothetical protein
VSAAGRHWCSHARPAHQLRDSLTRLRNPVREAAELWAASASALMLADERIAASGPRPRAHGVEDKGLAPRIGAACFGDHTRPAHCSGRTRCSYNARRCDRAAHTLSATPMSPSALRSVPGGAELRVRGRGTVNEHTHAGSRSALVLARVCTSEPALGPRSKSASAARLRDALVLVLAAACECPFRPQSRSDPRTKARCGGQYGLPRSVSLSRRPTRPGRPVTSRPSQRLHGLPAPGTCEFCLWEPLDPVGLVPATKHPMRSKPEERCNQKADGERPQHPDREATQHRARRECAPDHTTYASMMLPERIVLGAVHSHDTRAEEASPQRSATCMCSALIAEQRSDRGSGACPSGWARPG